MYVAQMFQNGCQIKLTSRLLTFGQGWHPKQALLIVFYTAMKDNVKCRKKYNAQNGGRVSLEIGSKDFSATYILNGKVKYMQWCNQHVCVSTFPTWRHVQVRRLVYFNCPPSLTGLSSKTVIIVLTFFKKIFSLLYCKPSFTFIRPSSQAESLCKECITKVKEQPDISVILSK